MIPIGMLIGALALGAAGGAAKANARKRAAQDEQSTALLGQLAMSGETDLMGTPEMMKLAERVYGKDRAPLLTQFAEARRRELAPEKAKAAIAGEIIQGLNAPTTSQVAVGEGARDRVATVSTPASGGTKADRISRLTETNPEAAALAFPGLGPIIAQRTADKGATERTKMQIASAEKISGQEMTGRENIARIGAASSERVANIGASAQLGSAKIHAGASLEASRLARQTQLEVANINSATQLKNTAMQLGDNLIAGGFTASEVKAVTDFWRGETKELPESIASKTGRTKQDVGALFNAYGEGRQSIAAGMDQRHKLLNALAGKTPPTPELAVTELDQSNQKIIQGMNIQSQALPSVAGASMQTLANQLYVLTDEGVMDYASAQRGKHEIIGPDVEKYSFLGISPSGQVQNPAEVSQHLINKYTQTPAPATQAPTSGGPEEPPVAQSEQREQKRNELRAKAAENKANTEFERFERNPKLSKLDEIPAERWGEARQLYAQERANDPKAKPISILERVKQQLLGGQ